VKVEKVWLVGGKVLLEVSRLMEVYLLAGVCSVLHWVGPNGDLQSGGCHGGRQHPHVQWR